ncbi:hypothetical protein [Streptomyces sp. DB-54]
MSSSQVVGRTFAPDNERERAGDEPEMHRGYVLPGVTFVPAEKVPPCPYTCDICRTAGRQA